jgi:pilus assembly protein FimV
MNRFIKISSLLSFMLLVSGEVFGAGLGKLSVSSVLGQPLRAEIDLLSVQPEELSTVEAKLASIEAYRQARIDRSSVLPDLHFTVDKRANGQPVVRITSSAPVSEPFVDLLVELNWSSGRILREYTVLLDPAPDQKPAADQAALPPVAATVSAPRTQAPTIGTPAKESSTAKSAPAEKSAAKSAGPAAETYGPVKSGETLRSIAGKVLPADVSIDMMMASLYHTNPKAFAKNNMNLLRKGQVLSVPDRDSVMQMFSPHQANKLIQEQAAAWHDIQNRLANQAAASVPAPTADKSAESGKIVQAQPQVKPAAEPVAKDVLKLSKGQPAKASADGAKRVHDLEEEVTAKNRALQDAQSRVGELEKTVQDLQHMMDLKAKQAATKAEPVATPPAASTSVAAPPVEEPKPEPKPVIKPVVKAAVPPPPVQEEPGFFSSLLANPLYIMGGVAALILAGLLWVFMVGSRRRKGLSDFEQSIMTGGDQFRTSIFKTTTGSKPENSTITQSGATTDFSRLGLGSIDTHEVDPIAEAEVYMAYGRDAQAEEILKEALAKEPQRHEIAVKLLEIYSTRQDTASFETQASELYANIGDPANSLWQKAAEMGRKIDPANPLYRVFGETPELPDVAEAVPVESHVEHTSQPLDDQYSAAMPPPATELHPEPVAESSHEASVGHDFDVDLMAGTEPEEHPAQPVEELAVPHFGLDFEPDAVAHVPAMTTLESAADLTANEFPSFGKADESDLAGLEEIDISAPMPATSHEEHDSDLMEELGDLDLMSEPLDEIMHAPAPAPVPEPAAALAKPEAKVESIHHDEAITLPDLDFSGIDLDLSDAPAAPAEPASTKAAEIEMPSVIDPDLLEEVNTKLDLAKAYLEMGDKEGAREILGEVIKEGDARQQKAANALMDEIG